MARGNPRQPLVRARRPAAADADAPLDYGSLRHALGYLVHLADLANLQGFARVFAHTGVTAARFTALELIACNPGIRPTALAAAMAVERSNLVSVMRFLVARGWVAAGAGGNRREKALSVTAAGAAALEDLRARLRRHDAWLGAGFTAAERDQLARLLARIVGAQAPARPGGARPPRLRTPERSRRPRAAPA